MRKQTPISRRNRIAALVAILALLLPTCTRGNDPNTNVDPNDRAEVERNTNGFETVEGIRIYKDIVYKEVDGTEVALDVYWDGEGRDPAIMLIHGGGWSLGDKDDSTSGGVLLAKEGFSAVVVDYRLSPPGGDWHAPAAVEDVRDAVLWIRDNGGDYGIDDTRIAAMGPSAGGHLAMMLGVTGATGRDKVEAAVSFSGPSDLTRDYGEPGFDPEDRRDIVLNFMTCRPDECPELYRAMSPIEHVDEDDSPIYQAISTDELTPAIQAERMARALEAAGVPNELRIVPGSRHGRGLYTTFGAEALRFIQQRFGTVSDASRRTSPVEIAAVDRLP